MARPTPFDRQTSFSQFSAQFPAKPQNGASIDAEFNAVKVALDETQSNLGRIQDDDGVLARGSVGRPQFDSSITLGFGAPSAWAVGTSYDADTSTVFYQSRFYIANTSHVSGDAFDASKWDQIADFSTSNSIDDGSITEAKLASAAVSAEKLASAAVTEPKIAAGAISTSKIADGALTRAKVADTAGPALASLILPAGLGPIPWSGRTAPVGWVLMGATYNRADFPALWAHAAAEIASGVNSLYGVGDGALTFTIVDPKGRTLVGVDAASAVVGGLATLGAIAGTKDVALTPTELPIITPTFTGTPMTAGGSLPNVALGSHANSTGGGAFPINTVDAGTGTSFTTDSFTPAGAISSFGGGSAHPNVQPSLAVNFIIKAH